jgi:hypothetical protein
MFSWLTRLRPQESPEEGPAEPTDPAWVAVVDQAIVLVHDDLRSSTRHLARRRGRARPWSYAEVVRQGPERWIVQTDDGGSFDIQRFPTTSTSAIATPRPSSTAPTTTPGPARTFRAGGTGGRTASP